MDELLAGARAGFDGVAVTEHGQSSYDMTPNPNLPAAVLANAIRLERPEAALIVLGRSLGKTREPLRIAEEYAMLDCLSGGRLVAGLPGRAQLRREPEQRDPDRSRRATATARRHDLVIRRVDRDRALPVERPLLAVRAGQLVAAAAAEAASAGLGPGIRHAGHDVLDDRARATRSST